MHGPLLKIAPSILAADFLRLGAEVERVIAAGADWIHVDVMDGHFVPNLSIGTCVVESLRRIKPAFLDVHLMIERPLAYVEIFRTAGADSLTVHVEARDDPAQSIAAVHRLGVPAGICLNPDTPAQAVFPHLAAADFVLVMSVHPGHGGQKFIPSSLEKIRLIRREMQAQGKPLMDLQVDGGIGADTGRQCIVAGANVLVAGTAVFRAPDPAAAIAALRVG